MSARNVSVGRVIASEKGICATLTSWLPTTPSTDARNVVLPALIAVTVPVAASIEATAEFEEDHCTTMPDIGDPLRSNTAAVSLMVEPSDPIVVGPVTLIVAALCGSVELPQPARRAAAENQIRELLTLRRYRAIG